MKRRSNGGRSSRPLADDPVLGIRALQSWAWKFDTQRGWDAVLPSDTAVHLMEEAGEVAREILRLGGYKPMKKGRSAVRGELGAELSDILFLCAKLANQYRIDLAGAVAEKIAVNERRFPPGAGKAEMRRYFAAKKTEWDRLRHGSVRRARKTHLTF